MTTEPRATTPGAESRASSRTKLYNRIDPIFILLDRLVFAPFFNPRLPGLGGPAATIEVPETIFLLDNIRKHRAILWANILALAAIIASGLPNLDRDRLLPLLPGLAAPVIVAGIAWYTISFSGVPERFGRHAMLVTGVLFLAVSFSLTTLFAVLVAVTPTPVAATVLAPIYLALYLAAVFYDNLDGLRAAASKGGLVFSRAQAYQSRDEPFVWETPQSESQNLRPVVQVRIKGERLMEVFNELTMRIDRLLEELAARKQSMIANVLIADCLNEIARVLSLTPHPLNLDEGFLRLVSHAHELSVEEVNDVAAHYLRVIVERVHAALGDPVAEEAAIIIERLGDIERIRSQNPTDQSHEASAKHAQELADFLFVEAIRQLVSMMRANRIHLLDTSVGVPK